MKHIRFWRMCFIVFMDGFVTLRNNLVKTEKPIV